MALAVLTVVLAIVIGAISFFSERIHITYSRHKQKTLSLTAGMFLTYIFLDSFPRIYTDQIELTRIALIFVVAGFGSFHLAQQYVYRHAHTTEQLRGELSTEHSVVFFIYHVVTGIVLATLITASLTGGLLFFVTLMSFTALTSISLREVHRHVIKNAGAKLVLSLSTLIGAIIAALASIPQNLYISMLGFVVGAMLYAIVTDALKKGKRGEPFYFALGSLLYFAVIYLTWFA